MSQVLGFLEANWEWISAILVVLAGGAITLAQGKAQAKQAGMEIVAYIVALARGAIGDVTQAEVKRVADYVYAEVLPLWVQGLVSRNAFADLVWNLWGEFTTWSQESGVAGPASRAMRRRPPV